MIAPIELIRLTIESMIDRKFGRVVNITSSAVKAPIAFLGLSNGARTGLTGFVAGLARQVIKHNVTINNLLPGYHATDRLGAAADAVAKQTGKNIEGAQQAPENAAHRGILMGFSAWSEETARTYLEKLSNHQRRAMQAQSTLC